MLLVRPVRSVTCLPIGTCLTPGFLSPPRISCCWHGNTARLVSQLKTADSVLPVKKTRTKSGTIKWNAGRVETLKMWNDETDSLFGPILKVVSEKKPRKTKVSTKASASDRKKISSNIVTQLNSMPSEDTSLNLNDNNATHSSTTKVNVEVAVSTQAGVTYFSRSNNKSWKDERCDYVEISPPPRTMLIDDTEHSANVVDNENNVNNLNLVRVQHNTAPILPTVPLFTSSSCSLKSEPIDSDLSQFLASILKTSVFYDTKLNENLNLVSENNLFSTDVTGERVSYSGDAPNSSVVTPYFHWMTSNTSVSLPPVINAHCPSVSLILRETMSAESRMVLERWEKKMIQELGQEGFNKFKQETFQKGTKLHSVIERFLEGQSIDVDPYVKGHWLSIEPTLGSIKDVVCQEVKVKHAALNYKGIFDCIATYKGTRSLIEWKTSKRSKGDIRQTFDNPLQVAAYLGAYNASVSSVEDQVKQCLLGICYEDGAPADVHVLDHVKCLKYWNEWLARVHLYWTQYITAAQVQH